MKLDLEIIKSDNAGQEPVICGLSRASMHDILRIENLSDRPAWSEALFAEEFLNSFAHYFGARIEGKLVGFLLCHCINDEAHILKFGILPDYRGRSIGRTLISYVLRDLYTNAAKWITLEVRKSNTIARKLYESLGFSEVGIREAYYTDNGEDALVLSLSLSHFIDLYGEHPELNGNRSEKQRAFHLFS